MNVILSESFTSAVSLPLASIPSPSVSYLQLGPFRIHFYALCILAGIIVCLWLSARRWAQVGGTRERVYDVAMWAIPAGIIGARAYHVLITDPGSYFGPNVPDPWAFLKIWEGGIGIMGAVSVGALGAWIACRRYQINYAAFADAVAPGIILAQAFGRWGNWFNQELFGKPTTLPWGLEISQSSGNFPAQYPAGTLFHPTFLYESLWNLVGAFLLIFLGNRFLKRGQTFWLYVLYYGIGRFFIEVFLRIDTSETLLGLRVHVWTSGALIVLGLIGFVAAGIRARAKAAAGIAEAPVQGPSVQHTPNSEKTAAQDSDEVSNQGKETLEESRISEKKVTEEKQATKDKEPGTQEEPADRVQTGDKQDKAPEIPWKKSKS